MQTRSCTWCSVKYCTVEGDVTVADQLTCSGPGGGDAEAVNHIVETALEEENEVLTLLAGHAGSLVVGVVELALQNSVHVLHLLLLLELVPVFLALFALGCETVLSRRIVSLFEIFVCTEDRFAELTGDLGGRACISCHSNFALKG